MGATSARRRTGRQNRWLLVGLVGAIALQFTAGVDACSVPVFRYALDHWLPDAYRIHILYDDAQTDEQAQIVERLQESARSRFANVVVEVGRISDLSDPALVAAVDKSAATDRPLCIVQGPTAATGVYRDIWSGRLVPETVDQLLGSPIRDRLVKLLLEGTSVVWIYLDSGVAPIDDANYKLLESELQRLQGVIELPVIDPIDLKELSASPDDVKLKFAALRLSRSDPKEAALVQMLLSSEADLRNEEFISQPMAFAVFGRGRVLYSLVGEGITAELIETASRFLTGACQCTVKAENPGVDLLLAVDWDGVISPAAPVEVDVTLTGLAGFQSDARASAPVATGNASPGTADLKIGVTETDATEAANVTAKSEAEDAPAAAMIDVLADSTGDIAEQKYPLEPTLPRRPTVPPAAATWPIVVISILAAIMVVLSIILLRRR